MSRVVTLCWVMQTSVTINVDDDEQACDVAYDVVAERLQEADRDMHGPTRSVEHSLKVIDVSSLQ